MSFWGEHGIDQLASRLSPGTPKDRILLLMSNALDSTTLAEWFRHRFAECETDAVSDLGIGLSLCRRSPPRLLVLDPACGEKSLSKGLDALRAGVVEHLLVLDLKPLEARVFELLHESAASYVTRAAGPQVLANAVRNILRHGQRAFDPALESLIRRTPAGWSFDGSALARALAALSARERQVLQLLVEGATVRQCADSLGLSQSTIENHKSRLMKKMGVHKTCELTLHAIRLGFVDV